MNKNKLNLVVNRQEQMQNDSTLTGPRGAGGLHNISFHPRKSGLKGGGWVISRLLHDNNCAQFRVKKATGSRFNFKKGYKYLGVVGKVHPLQYWETGMAINAS